MPAVLFRGDKGGVEAAAKRPVCLDHLKMLKHLLGVHLELLWVLPPVADHDAQRTRCISELDLGITLTAPDLERRHSDAPTRVPLQHDAASPTRSRSRSPQFGRSLAPATPRACVSPQRVPTTPPRALPPPTPAKAPPGQRAGPSSLAALLRERLEAHVVSVYRETAHQRPLPAMTPLHVTLASACADPHFDLSAVPLPHRAPLPHRPPTLAALAAAAPSSLRACAARQPGGEQPCGRQAALQ